MTERDKPRLGSVQLRVQLEDGTDVTTWVATADMARWDRVRSDRKWPTQTEGPFLWLTFVAWASLSRQKLIPAIRFEDFEAQALEISNVDEPDEDAESGGLGYTDPTQPAPEPG